MTETTIDLSALRTPFPAEYVGKLPRVTCKACSERGTDCPKHAKVDCAVCGNWLGKHIHLDYVGHADVTIRLLEVDPEWSWAPKATDADPELLKAAMASGDPEIVRAVIENAPPKFDTDRNGSPVGLWIKLTVGGVTRLGVGSCPSGQNDAEKVLIGDALRNAAMRFGVAVDLWAKGDRADPTAENATASAGQASKRSSGPSASDAFENAAPAARQPAQQQRGQVSRPAAPVAAVPAEAQDADMDAQAYADEAHGALTPRDLEDIQRRAREAGKLSALVRNPSSDGTGKPGKLAVYLDWKRKQIKEAGDALTDLGAQAAERGIANLEDWFKGEMRADIETASAAQLREAVRLLPKTAVAA